MTNLKKCTPFGMQVKIALIKNNMTNQELAQKLGYTNSTISDVIFGRNLSQRTKERIAKELGIEIEME
ncbi:XRE family transcriptional regulator [Clostridium sp. chh4-2]|uniref:helix-turn-helix domain-containing protein n=1 Tax=Clostridium sp. chh4-2 TaxID=2067550 RepID=UPI000CCF2DBA|nr:helix-turn-helix transcriptional regulator [Clostridium sp. chh4-2]PNV59589.1 XRE family transcriptional regulator [Clostridium sp. chh4-2]PNV61709.1 XRE family transcriptional regulator [Clostridium sp. chh4-2]